MTEHEVVCTRMNLRTFLAVLACVAAAPKALCADLADALAGDSPALLQMVKQWPLNGPAGAVEQREWKPADLVFGTKPQRALATVTKDALTRLDVLFATKDGPNAGTFEADFTALKKELPAAIQATLGIAGTPTRPEPSMPPGSEVLGWNNGKVTMRVTFEPGRRVWFSAIPVVSLPVPAKSGPPATVDARELAKSKVKVLPNGDSFIENLPKVEGSADASENHLRMCEFLQRYYQWKADPAEAVKAGQGLDSFARIEAVLKQLVKLAGSRMKVVKNFDLNDAKRDLAKGRPVAVAYAHNARRVEFWEAFVQKHAADPTAELPPAKDPEDRKKWQDPETADYYAVGFVVGFNDKRNEVLLRIAGYDSEFPNFRLRPEELIYTTYQVFYISPD